MRRRFRWDRETKTFVEVDLGYSAVSRVPVIGEAHYEGLKATDGTPLDTRAKHAAYLKEHGLALMSDFTEHWKQKEKERAAGGSPAERRERRDDVGRALYNLEMGRQKPPDRRGF